MIRAYILIETTAGKTYRYVRNALAANALGVAEKFYRYRGNGYQELGLTVPSDFSPTILEFDTIYYFKVAVDGGSIVEYNFSIPSPSSTIGVLNTRRKPTYANLLEKLSQTAKDIFFVKLIDRDIRFVSPGSGTTTAISITAGTSGTDLLTALDTTPPTAIVSDNYDNQITIDGKVNIDYSNLVTNWLAGGLLDFPENPADTSVLRRDNYWNGTDDNSDIIVQLDSAHVCAISVIEEKEEGMVYKP